MAAAGATGGTSKRRYSLPVKTKPGVKPIEVKELRRLLAAKDREIHALTESRKTSIAPAVKGVPVLTDADRELIRALISTLQGIAYELGGKSGAFISGCTDRVGTEIRELVDNTIRVVHTELERFHEIGRNKLVERLELKGLQRIIEKLDRVTTAPAATSQNSHSGISRNAPVFVDSKNNPNKTGGKANSLDSASRPAVSGDLSGPEQRILDAIAWLESVGNAEPELAAVAFLAGYTVDGGAFNNPRGKLRGRGLVEYLAGGRIRLTIEGRATANQPAAPLSSQDLQAAVLGRLPGPEQRLLQPLIAAYPKALSNEELANKSGYTAGAGAFNNPRGRLRSLGLVEYPQPGFVVAKSLLFLDGR